MRITIDSTPALVRIGEFATARRWEGVTDGGIPVVALILAVSPQTDDPAVAAQFAAELHEIRAHPAPYIKQGYGASEEVDRARVEPLAEEIARVILGELARQPWNPDNVVVVLNALAAAAAVVIAGADERARQFFGRALADNIAELQQQACGAGK